MNAADLALNLAPLLAVGAMALAARAYLMRAGVRHLSFFYRRDLDDRWPDGVQEDDDARWQWHAEVATDTADAPVVEDLPAAPRRLDGRVVPGTALR